MVEDIISLETAKLAKERGFPQAFNKLRGGNYYNYLGELNGDVTEKLSRVIRKEDYSGFENVSAPTQALLAKWLRDVHGWHIITIPVVTMCYTFKILKVWKKDFDPNLDIETPPYSGVNAYDYSSHEEALEAGLLEVLKLL